MGWFTAGDKETKVSPNDLITEEEFEAMLNAYMNSRDRAFISLLYESGARRGYTRILFRHTRATRLLAKVPESIGMLLWLLWSCR